MFTKYILSATQKYDKLKKSENEKKGGAVLKTLGSLIEQYRSLSMIGMCKNAGKTTAFNELIRELNTRDEVFAVTSIGRDGESSDLVTGTKKPGIYVHKGTLIATTSGLLKWCDITKEVLATTNMGTPMGDVVLLRALSDGNIQLAGPSMNDQLIEVSEMFKKFGAHRILIDGAISRKTLCSKSVTEATVLCTGASYHKDIQIVVAHTAYFCEILSLKAVENSKVAEAIRGKKEEGKVLLINDSGETAVCQTMKAMEEALYKKAYENYQYIYVNGALSDGALKPVLISSAPLKNKTFIVSDSSKILLTAPVYEKIGIKGAHIEVLDQIHLAAVTINPFSAYGYDFDKDEFFERMSAAVNVPVINVEDKKGDD